MTNITRKIPRQQMIDWGLPHGDDWIEVEAKILDNVDMGSGRWMEYHQVIFKAPDDGLIYAADYETGLTESQFCYPWEDDKEVTCVRVESKQRVITVTDWIPVKQPVTPQVPTLAQLKKSWKRNLEDDDMAGVEW